MPNWGVIFSDCSLPVLLDIGCARGMFVEGMSVAFPARNYIGVEIRAQLVEEALARTEAQRSTGCNLMFVAANVLQDGILADLLSSLANAGLKVGIPFSHPPDCPSQTYRVMICSTTQPLSL
jgi:tRNA (guanine-N7-)-methyltransferase